MWQWLFANFKVEEVHLNGSKLKQIDASYACQIIYNDIGVAFAVRFLNDFDALDFIFNFK